MFLYEFMLLGAYVTECLSGAACLDSASIQKAAIQMYAKMG